MKPNRVVETLKKHIIMDGFHVVADLEKSEGSWIVDAVSGLKYLDCYSQFASQALGWNHPSLRKLMENDQEVVNCYNHRMANSDMYSTAYARFTDAFSRVTPDFSHYFFIDGGALGIENALKASFDWKAQKLGITDEQANELDVIHLRDAFHGRTGYTLSLTNTGELKTKWFPKFNWTRIINPKTQHRDIEAWEHRSLNQAEDALKTGRVAAIILEPVQGEGGDNHFRPAYFKALRDLADRYEAMLIFDEVQTGMGLTGRMWAYEHTGVVPDMMCFGKKSQVCGFCSTERIDDVKNNVFAISGRINSTWGGNLMDMVRCTHILQVIKDEHLIENARAVGNYFTKAIAVDINVSYIRGKGLMIAFDLPSEPKRDQIIKRLSTSMLTMKCGQRSIRFRPPLTFSMADAKKGVEFLKIAVN